MERRSATRYPLTAPLEFRLLSPEHSHVLHKGLAVNMSSSGLLFESLEEPPGLAQPLQLSILWPAHPKGVQRWLTIWGKVTRITEHGAAVEIRQYTFEERPSVLRPPV